MFIDGKDDVADDAFAIVFIGDDVVFKDGIVNCGKLLNSCCCFCGITAPSSIRTSSVSASLPSASIAFGMLFCPLSGMWSLSSSVSMCMMSSSVLSTAVCEKFCVGDDCASKELMELI